MTPVSTPYLAGFLDGEGCFTTYATARTAKHRPYHSPRITVSLTHRPTLDRLAAQFGGRVCQSGQRKDGWKQKHQWAIAKKDAIKIAEAVLPYLITKQAACEKWLELARVPELHRCSRPVGWRPGTPGGYGQCECERCCQIAEDRTRIHAELRELNKRGLDEEAGSPATCAPASAGAHGIICNNDAHQENA